MVTQDKKLLFFLGAVTWLIALFIKVNIPELKDAATIYIDIISFVLIGFLIIEFVFKGRFSFK